MDELTYIKTVGHQDLYFDTAYEDKIKSTDLQ